jgi:methyltransferase (TIGR00027 family)
MRHDRPSSTATMIAVWRGVAGLEEPLLAPDAVAERLVPSPYRQALALARHMPRTSATLLRLADRAMRGRIRHMAFRTRTIDDVIAAGMAADIDQVVVLGAGLDARAWRLPALRNAIVFEVDHPATQVHKRARLTASGVRLCARDIRFAAVDLERDNVVERLAEIGHDHTRPSVFVCEGVLMYLTPEAADATLRALATLGAVGSLLALSYCVVPGVDPVTAAVLSLVGEPIRTRLDPPDMTALLARHGFTTTSDAGDREWARMFDKRPGAIGAERVIVARRRNPNIPDVETA